MAASFSFTRNGGDIGGTAAVGQLIDGLLKIEKQIKSVMDFIKNFQPQIGWKFVFEVELFKGKLSCDWGYREWTDQTVFRWWKFEADLTLLHVSAELSFGIDVKVCHFGVTLLVFGNVEGEAKASASKEATPSDWAPFQLGASAQVTGALGVRGAVGDNWASVEGRLTCDYPFEATCACSSEEPFHIDWKLDFAGINGILAFHTKWGGEFRRATTITDGWPAPHTGRFPGGAPERKPPQGGSRPIPAQ